jgi:DNA-binding transcriptional regulator YiaG
MATDTIRETILYHATVREVGRRANEQLARLARDEVVHEGNEEGTMSAAEFARLAGVPQSTVKRWVESG